MSHLSEEELNILSERERNRAQLPLTNWESLSAQLRDDGIIRDSVIRNSGNQWWLRAAAAVLLVAAGAVAGRYTKSSLVERSQPIVAQASAGYSITPVTNDSTPTFSSEGEAWDALNQAGAQYQRASEFLASRDANRPMDSASVYQARLAALDGMTSASRKALYAAPHDPVINQYYLAAQGAREATIRQLSTSLPSGVRLNKW